MLRRIIEHRFRRTTLIVVGCCSVLVGLAIARITKVDTTLAWVALGLCLLFWRKHSVITIISISLCGVSIGLLRGAVYMHKLADYRDLSLQKVTIVGQAQDDAVYGKNYQLTFPMGHLQVVEPHATTLTGNIKVSGFGEAAIFRGDTVRVSGKLYPTRGSNQASVGFAELSVMSRGHSFVNDVRRRFAAGMQSALPEPLASFGLGLLIGQRSTLPVEISSQLQAVGLTHIIAVSGYNLTILVEVARRLLTKRSKFQSLLFSLLMIGAFLLLAGSSASITRAAFVSVLSLVAWYYGRKVRPMVLITLAAAITALANPFYIWSDIGWYLSFLAFFGVLVLAPLVSQRLFGERKVSALNAMLVESACAQLMTIPIILYIFGQVSLVALPSNALVVALVPLGMLLTLAAGLSGMLVSAVGGWFAWPARLLLTYMLDVVSLLSRVPHAFVQQLTLPATQMVMMYAAVVVLSVLLWIKIKKNSKITETSCHPELDSGSIPLK